MVNNVSENSNIKGDANQNRIYVQYGGVTGNFVNNGVDLQEKFMTDIIKTIQKQQMKLNKYIVKIILVIISTISFSKISGQDKVTVLFKYDPQYYKKGDYFVINCEKKDTIWRMSVTNNALFAMYRNMCYLVLYPVDKKGCRYGGFKFNLNDSLLSSDKISISIRKYDPGKKVKKSNVYIDYGYINMALFTEINKE